MIVAVQLISLTSAIFFAGNACVSDASSRAFVYVLGTVICLGVTLAAEVLK